VKRYFISIDYRRLNTNHAKNSLNRNLVSKEKLKAKRRSISGLNQYDNKNNKTKFRKKRRGKVLEHIANAPSDLRLIENTIGCLSFFRDLRSEEYQTRKHYTKFVTMSLKNVVAIDYGTISILTAINDEFKFKKIILKTILPTQADCHQFMIESGYLNNLVNEKGKPFPKTEKSDMIFFEKGSGVLLAEDNIKISSLVKNVVKHLTGISKYCLPIKTVILEICGNSIEWSGTESRQWLLGVKYESDKVVFTVTDVGKGILETLYIKFSKKFFEPFRSKDNILKEAFDKKLGSNTQEVNRNKGLPAIKSNYEKGIVQKLKVITNNVILHFDNDQLSKTFDRGSPRFRGTFYQWEMNKDCLDKLKI